MEHQIVDNRARLRAYLATRQDLLLLAQLTVEDALSSDRRKSISRNSVQWTNQ